MHRQSLGTRFLPFDDNDHGVIVVVLGIVVTLLVLTFETSDAAVVRLREAMSNETDQRHVIQQ